ncbi:hypothetical protein MKX01_003807 [Papaver californicum]|nr:hypothetical protein MKX01_003807 [Papaver californicum]
MDEDNDEKRSVTSQQQLTTISQHNFGFSEPGQTNEEAFSISIMEIWFGYNISANFFDFCGVFSEHRGRVWMFVWPCSIVLAEYIWQQRSFFIGKSVLELGAGTSLPGLVAAKVRSYVTLTDDSSRPEVLENMRRVCHLNKLNCKIMGITWGEWDLPIFNLQPSIILGADVLYDSKDFDNLFTTVTFLLQNSPGSVFITSYHNRRYFIRPCTDTIRFYLGADIRLSFVPIPLINDFAYGHLIEYLMVKWSLKCTKFLDAFSFMPSCKSSTLTGNIQLVEISLDDQ